MKKILEEKCQLFVKNKQIMEKGFAWQGGGLHLLSAAVCMMRGIEIYPGKIKECRELIRKNTGIFSSFRSYSELILATFLSMEENPGECLRVTLGIYEKLKKDVWDSTYLPVIAYVLYKRADLERVDQISDKAGIIYKGMKKSHPFLTGTEDFNYAILFAMEDQSAEACLREMENCYGQLVKTFGKQNTTQTLSHILGLGEEPVSYKTARTIHLYERLRETGVKYPKEEASIMLAALALAITDDEVEEAVAQIAQVTEWLKKQKGFGTFSVSSHERMMYAALLTADSYVEIYRDGVVETAMANSLISMLVAELTAMMAVSAAVMASTTTDS